MRKHLGTALLATLIAAAVASTVGKADIAAPPSAPLMGQAMGASGTEPQAGVAQVTEVTRHASEQGEASAAASRDVGCPIPPPRGEAVCIEPEAYHTRYSLRTKTGDGKDMVVLSGYAEIDGEDLKGNPDGSWNRKGLVFRIGPRWRTVDVVPVVSMTSIMNSNVANNAGWAVDDCKLIDTVSATSRFETLQCRVAVRDSDGFMFRVNYYVTMVGRLA